MDKVPTFNPSLAPPLAALVPPKTSQSSNKKTPCLSLFSLFLFSPFSCLSSLPQSLRIASFFSFFSLLFPSSFHYFPSLVVSIPHLLASGFV